MESKKINQLATELTPALDDLTIIGDPTTGVSKKITLSQMASLFTGTVEEYANLAAFPLVGTADTIYIALDTNVLYRWDTSLTSYVELSPNIINSLVFNDANGFDGTIALVGSVATLTITTALTTGSVGFIGASGALLQDNANFFWDDSNNRLGIGTNAPTTAIDVFGSGIIARLNGTSTNNAFLGFASAGSNKWSIGNVQSDHRFRIYNEATTSELVSILQTGEFGIGIANPTTKFHIDGAASALIANLDANVSVAKSISFRSDNSNRFNIEVSGTESGSNAGANLFIRRYSDAGALIDTPLTITRSTGLITLATALSGTTATFSVSDGTTNILKLIRTSTREYGITLANGDFNFVDNTEGKTRFIIATTGAATLSNSLTDRTKGLTIQNFDGGYGRIQFSSNADYYIGGGEYGAELRISSANSPIQFWTNGSQKMALNSSGNLGLGVIPNAWDNSIFRAIQIGVGIPAFLIGRTDSFANVQLGVNAFFDGSWKYIGNDIATRYFQTTGGHAWETSVSGIAGNIISFIRGMTLNSSGNLGVATDNPLSKLHIVGSSTAINNSGIIQLSTGTAFATNKLIFGINDGSYAWIQAIHPDVAYRSLVLQGGGGNVLIGTTTDNGSKLQVTGNTTLQNAQTTAIRTNEGTVSNPYNVWTTMFTIPSGTVGRYELIAVSEDNGGSYTSQATVVVNKTYVAIRNYTDGGVLAIQASGYDIQCKNGSGATLVIKYKYLRIE